MIYYDEPNDGGDSDIDEVTQREVIIMRKVFNNKR